jgi:REP-associated tyrosine transposase
MVAMPNHWHFVLRPATDDQVSEFFRRLTVMHTMRYHAPYKTGGTGHLYQGRFKSFPIQSDEHLLMVTRYVERNPVRANFTELAEAWQGAPHTFASSQPANTAGSPHQSIHLLRACGAHG